MTIKINVPDDKTAEVEAWEDGTTYDIQAVQTAPGQFDYISGAPVMAEEPVEDDEATESGPPMPKAGGYGMKDKHRGMPPALTVIIGGKPRK